MKLWTPSKELHLPAPDIIGFYLEVGAWDKAGKLYHQERIRSRSPVKQFLQMLACRLQGADLASVTDTGSVARTLDHDNTVGPRILGGITNDSEGIVIGTGTTAVDMTDVALVTKIAHGSAATQMLYAAQVNDTDVAVADPDCTWACYRNFNNNSGGSSTVGETGLYAAFRDTGATVRYFLMVRDVPTAVAVPDGGGCYVKYTLKITE